MKEFLKFEYQSGGSEAAEQEVLFAWAELQTSRFPELEFMYHIPNEGKRTKYTGALLKRAGLKRGVPDICLPAPRKDCSGLYIEMKFGKNKPTEFQNKYIAYLRSAGYAAEVCYSAGEAIEIIKKYLKKGTVI